MNPSSGPHKPTCEAHTRTGKVCGNRARFVYQVVDGRIEHLCGQHVGPGAKDSRYLREIR